MDYALLLSSIVLGAGAVFLFRLNEPHKVKLLNAFTGAYLLCLTLLHLLPDIYQAGAAAHAGHAHAGGHAHTDWHIGALILLGFFTQVALDVISMGVEHGHAHHLHNRMPIGVMLGLCMHALFEATALGNPGEHFNSDSRQLLLWSIVLHNFPVSVALLGMLLQTGMRRRTALMMLAIFASMAPIGMTLSAHTGLANYTRELMAFVIGIFMHISTTILFESSDIHRFNFAKLAAIIIGLVLGTLSVMSH